MGVIEQRLLVFAQLGRASADLLGALCLSFVRAQPGLGSERHPAHVPGGFLPVVLALAREFFELPGRARGEKLGTKGRCHPANRLKLLSSSSQIRFRSGLHLGHGRFC